MRLFSLALGLFALSFTIFAVQSGDVLMYLALARDYLLAGRWAETDIYLYPVTDGRLVFWHEYLSYLIFHFSWAALGAAGLTLVKALTLGAMFALVLRAEPREEDANPAWMGLWALAVVAGSFRYIERSSVFSDLFSVLVASMLVSAPRPSRALALRLAVVFLLWVQLHPGFPVGLIFLGVWMVFDLARHRDFGNRARAWLALPAAALLVNPRGWTGALYPFHFSLAEAATLRHYNFEWFPAYHPAFRFAPEVMAFWLLALVTSVFFARARAWRSLHFWLALTAFALTLGAVRFMPWAAMVLALTVKPYCALSAPRLRDRRWAGAVAGLFLLVAVKNFAFGYHASSGDRRPGFGFDPKFFPSQTLEVLRTHPIPGRLYNSHDLGSSLIWNGMTPVFHHGFVTDMRFYREDVIGAIRTRERFLELAAKYGWTMLLVDKYGGYREMHRILSPLPEWKIVAEDEASYLIYKLP